MLATCTWLNSKRPILSKRSSSSDQLSNLAPHGGWLACREIVFQAGMGRGPQTSGTVLRQISGITRVQAAADSGQIVVRNSVRSSNSQSDFRLGQEKKRIREGHFSIH